MAQQSSRLQRLLTLLDSILRIFLIFTFTKLIIYFFLELFFNQLLKAGSTQATRLTAARQIGDIAKSHPQDLNSLLKKVLIFLMFYACFCCNMFSLYQIYALFSCSSIV